MQFKRKISDYLLRLSADFPVLVVTGARQVGKTTLLRHLFPKHSYVSLDLPSLADEAENNPEAFLLRYASPLLVDEVQYAPKLFRHLKALIDSNRHAAGRWVLTGSQKFVLMKEVSESLAGRAAIVDLENLSVPEVLQDAQYREKPWVEWLTRGMFPELWRQNLEDSSSFYSSYVATYLERDLRQLLRVQSLRDFERFIRSCATRSGQLLNMSELARDVGVKVETVRQWLSVLEASNQVTLLEPYFENLGKRLVKSPKLFFNDSGLMCFLLGLDARALSRSALIGNVWETFVFSELRKALRLEDSLSKIWFYRDAQTLEVDFVIDRGGVLTPVEAKWRETWDDSWTTNLHRVVHELKRSKTKSVGLPMVISPTSTSQNLGSAIHAGLVDWLKHLG